ncbi:hypothetical protein [Paenibacillus gallinarum]|uniref:DUF983 domain-containing protein n=1 Tax=Paenibacillus gallinarum TaxID=2762232 RepID=A0ABR8SXV3_9BACL|nr:hypothetical protein [Paenibacillus gallinarum]MBD7968336.1 hypothetical protein [Paenibacillus gallinarum]
MSASHHQHIYCVHCNAEIESRYDLLVNLSFFSLSAYHTSCYSEALKGCQSIFLDGSPVNGAAFSWTSGFAFLFGMILLFIPKENIGGSRVWLLNVVLLLFPLARLCSWYIYERHLDK